MLNLTFVDIILDKQIISVHVQKSASIDTNTVHRGHAVILVFTRWEIILLVVGLGIV